MCRRTSRRSAADATTPCATRSATYRWSIRIAVSGVAWPGHQGRRRRPTRCSRRSTTPGAGTAGGRRPSRARSRRAGSIPADVTGGVEIPDAGVELELPAGETAARRQWKKFVDSGLADYADDRNRPDLPATSRMSAHLKFGTIHPRTMAADLGRGKGAQAYLRELAFRDFYAAVLNEWPDSAWWNWNKSFDAMQLDEGRGEDGLRGVEGRPHRASRSSTPACASSPRPAGCTTGCG